MVLDPAVRRFDDGRVLMGGYADGVLRLSAAQARALDDLATGWADDEFALRLARTLVDGGYAHPRPAPVRVHDVTVVIPVRDRPDELDGCLVAVGNSVPVIVVDDGSVDAEAVARVVNRHGARLVRRAVNGGPGPARNSGVAAVCTAFVAFLDSDARPPADWLSRLLGHFADPMVAAVAARVVGRPDASLTGRYLAARSPLDQGPNPGIARPGGAVGYVPSASLVVRRSAIPAAPFDPALRYGEDVDLIWRLHDSGWQVRYDPSVHVEHVEPSAWRDVLRRRYNYGTGAALLAARHPGRVTSLVLNPQPAVAAGLLFLRRPAAALGAMLAPATARREELVRVGVPPVEAAYLACQAVAKGVLSSSSNVSFAVSSLYPFLLLPMLRRDRRTLALVVAPALADWLSQRPSVDPFRWTAMRLMDEAAHGAGVWRGCWTTRTIGPLLPRFRRPS